MVMFICDAHDEDYDGDDHDDGVDVSVICLCLTQNLATRHSACCSRARRRSGSSVSSRCVLCLRAADGQMTPGWFWTWTDARPVTVVTGEAAAAVAVTANALAAATTTTR